MAKTKKTTEPHYELLYIISNKFTEDEAKAIAAKIEAVVVSNDGVVTYREDWGKKKLAYPIDHFAFGYYIYIEFDVEGIKLAKIERSVRLMHEVIRHQIVARQTRTIDMKEKPKVIFAEEVKATTTIPAPAKVEVAKEDAPKVEAKPIEEVVVETPAVATEEKTVEETPKKAAKAVKAPKETKASMEELDAKLDKILETDDLI